MNVRVTPVLTEDPAQTALTALSARALWATPETSVRTDSAPQHVSAVSRVRLAHVLTTTLITSLSVSAQAQRHLVCQIQFICYWTCMFVL